MPGHGELDRRDPWVRRKKPAVSTGSRRCVPAAALALCPPERPGEQGGGWVTAEAQGGPRVPPKTVSRVHSLNTRVRAPPGVRARAGEGDKPLVAVFHPAVLTLTGLGAPGVFLKTQAG